MVDYGYILRDFGVDTADPDEVFETLRETHGDIEDAKAAMILISDEEGFEVEAADVETVTSEPPSATFL